MRLRLEDAAAAARHQAALGARAEGQLASMRASAMAAAAEAAQVLFIIHGTPSETPGQGMTACVPLPPPPPAQVPGTLCANQPWYNIATGRAAGPSYSRIKAGSDALQ